MLALVPFDETLLPALALLQPGGAAPGSLRRELTDIARGGGEQVVVAVEDGRACGVAGADTAGHVDEIGVDESLRGCGIALALYRIASEVLVARGVSRLTTLLASTNTATLRLHEKLGFTEFTRRTVFALEV